MPGRSTANWNLSGRGPSICSRRPFGHLKAPLGFHCFANANFTYLDNGNVNFPDNKKYSRSKPTIIRIPPTTLMPIRLTLLFFIILFAKTNSSAPTTIIKTDINGYMSFLLSNSDLLISNLLAANSISCCLRTASPQGIAALAAQGGVATLTERSDATFSVEQFSSADRE